jgi:dTDP-4-dehydrorhamnose 3,5-epimerase
MIFVPTALEGAFLIELERIEDERGFFARSWCQEEFAKHGLRSAFVQCNISFNSRKGTLRGMHYQAAPFEEAKLVRCTKGAMYDVILDLRSESPSFRHWEGFELTAENRRMLYVPEGFAHGFQTLADDTEVFYQMSAFYRPEAARGVRWNDPAFAVAWPCRRPHMSPRDRGYPDFELPVEADAR